MKIIVAIVRPIKIDDVVNRMDEIDGFPGMTVVDSAGFGQRLRNASVDVFDPFKPNKRIEIVACDEMVEPLVAAIKESAHTGRKGDGIVFVMDVESFGVI